MKKFLALLLTLTMAASLAACGSKPTQEQETTDTQAPTESSSGERLHAGED